MLCGATSRLWIRRSRAGSSRSICFQYVSTSGDRKRVADLGGAPEADDGSLGEVDAERLGDRLPETRVGGAVVEVRDDDPVALAELAGRHQRANGPDPRQTHRGVGHRREPERGEGEHAAADRLPPGEQAVQAAGRSGHHRAAGPSRRAAALQVAGDEDDGEADEEEHDGTGEDPVGQAEPLDEEVHQTEDPGGRGGEEERDARRVSLPDRLLRALDIAAVAPVGASPPLGVAAPSSWANSSPALCQRSAGRFSRQRMRTALSAGDTAARCLVTGSGAG